MGINDRMIFSTPPADAMVVVKTPVNGATCPECGGDDVRRYPIGYFKGPRIVVKCQSCYHSLAVERPTAADVWPPFRSATYDWDVSPAERASATRAR